MQRLLRLSSTIDRFNDAVGKAVSWLTFAMVVVGSLNAVFRYVGRFTGFDLSSNAYLESQWYLFSIVFLLAASYTLRQDAHVRVDVLYGRLSPKGKAWLNLAGGVLFLIPFSVLMIWVSWPWVLNSWDVLEVSPDPGGLPRYPLKAIIPVTFALLIIQGVSEIIKAVAAIRDVGRWTLDVGRDDSDVPAPDREAP